MSAHRDGQDLPGVDPAFARSARRWLLAYPPPWRARRGDEMTSLLADLAEPGARRVGLRAGLPLLWSGLRTRRCARPPLHVVVGYRALERPVPARYRPWVRADLEAPWRPLREIPWRLAYLLPLAAFVLAGIEGADEAVGVVAWALVLVAIECGLDTRRRQRAAERHLLPGAGETAADGGARRAVVLRDRVAARPAARAAVRTVAVLVAGAGGVLAVVAARGDAEPASAVAPAAALVVGGAVAAAARRRRRWLADPPPQPGRRVVEATPGLLLAGPVAAVAAVLGVVALLLGGDVHGQWGTLLLTVALAAAPVVVSTWRWVAGRPGLVAVDVVRALADGLPPAVDLPRPGLVPVDAGPAGRPTPSP